jgi:broad specificity phosphatase PhoE
MRYLEVRRHTMRAFPGQHLTQAGLDLARRVGEQIGPFDRVVTTLAPRAFETAIAMGFAVDKQSDNFPLMNEEIASEIEWDAGYAAWSRMVQRGRGAAARFARQEAAAWREIVEALPEGGRALLISHGGAVEAGAAACLSAGEHTTLETNCGYCEGVRLSFNGTDWTAIEVLRVAQPAI